MTRIFVPRDAAAVALEPASIVAQVTESGLRGRGGAGFPTGVKWKTVLDCPGGRKYIVCNADEGDSGSFADRMIMEDDPFVVIEGMIIAGPATGATKGFPCRHRLHPWRRGRGPNRTRHRAGEDPRAARRSLQHDEIRLPLALGGFTPYPVMSAVTHFPEDFIPAPQVEATE